MLCTGVYAALRASGKKADLSLVVADEPAVAAGCFTKNVMCAAPVLYCKDVLERKQKIKAVSRNRNRSRSNCCWWWGGDSGGLRAAAAGCIGEAVGLKAAVYLSAYLRICVSVCVLGHRC